MRSVVLAIVALLLAGAGPIDDAPLDFAAEVHPPAPDYAAAASWAARPGAEGLAAAVPPNATPAATRPAVDVFFVHPTTYRSKTRWNPAVDDAETNDWTGRSVVARQASAFNGCCRIFAPRYRQASLRAFSAMAGDGGKAYDLAYGDVLRAFDYYLAHDNHGRPFILAGHSQGALHVFGLLRDRIDGTPLGQRMVAAYILGFGISEGDFGTTFHTVKPCTTPAQVRCVIGWNSFLDGSDTAGYITRSQARFVAAYGDRPGKALLCFNPLAGAAFGALPAGDTGVLPSLRAGAVTAHCEGGVLLVSPDMALSLTPLPGGNMHYHDIALFYADIRADAARRAQAFLKETTQ